MPGCRDTEPTIPDFIVQFSGRITTNKKVLANSILVDWQVGLKKVKQTKNDECPYLQPSAQNVMLRIMIGRLKKHYNFHFSLDHFCGWTNSLGAVMGNLYTQRLAEYVSEK